MAMAISHTQWPSAATPGPSFLCGTSSFTARPGRLALSTTVDKQRRRNAVVRCARPGPPVQNRHSGAFIPAQHRWMYEGIKSLGPDIWNKTYYPKAADHLNANKTWYIVDASNKRLGRLASAIAYYIRGKNNPMYTPSLDMGSYVVVVNAEKVGVTGKKRSQKLYRRHSGRPGGLKEETFDQLQKRIPERIVEHAVKGMLPKNRLGRALFRHLKVYKGEEHPHAAQGPVPLPLLDKRINLVTE